jgi:hypothetical protein
MHTWWWINKEMWKLQLSCDDLRLYEVAWNQLKDYQ